MAPLMRERKGRLLDVLIHILNDTYMSSWLPITIGGFLSRDLVFSMPNTKA